MTINDTPSNFQSGSNGDAAGDYLTAAKRGGEACRVAAHDYLARGWSSLAVCPPDHAGVGKKHGQECDSPGKAPWGLWKEYQSRLPADKELDKKWRDNPLLNVGIALGPVSGLVRVDVDGEEGERFLLEVSGGDIPDTLEMTSGGDGRGLLYAIPPGVVLRPTHQHGQKVHSGLSLLGQGSQTVMPPSRHKSGRRYTWKPGHGPDEIKSAPAPTWLIKLMSEGQRNGQGGKARSAPLEDGEVISDGKRDTTLASLAGSMRRRGMTADEIFAALMAVNERCDPPLSEAQVRKIADSIARYPPAEAMAASVKLASSWGKGTEGKDIIRAYWEETLKPRFRRGEEVYSEERKGTVRRTAVCFGANTELLKRLEKASNAPKVETKSGQSEVKAEALPGFFKKWAPTAWEDMCAALDEEANAQEVCEPAAEEFHRALSLVLCQLVALGELRTSRSGPETVIERRTLLDFATRFAKPGTGWQRVRSYFLWGRRDTSNSPLRLAVRVELLGQVHSGDLARLTPRRFSDLCRLYNVGAAGDDCRPGGARAVELTADFIAGLPDERPMATNNESRAEGDSCGNSEGSCYDTKT